ncbi:EboA domain-containing protein [Pedobacter gandavensis]|uniref:EboA domain-containing protein n=1 Tax=Pedobacter gandavensis TaxID=2679963 RepID=UPI00292E2CFE|nr:EboA domain-containing protein [Pedobacter gandavensis]
MEQLPEINTQELLQELLSDQLSELELTWFNLKIKSLEKDELLRQFIPLFSLIPRFIKAGKVEFSDHTLELLELSYPGFSSSDWNLQELCRIMLMVSLDPAENEKVLKKLFEAADINELRILYKALYFLDNAADFTDRLVEGVRTNMTDVLDAIVANNPFPARYLSEDAWNQMVMKAVFTGRPLFSIYGIDRRANEKLAKILHGYIQERKSAGRTVSPEVWRLLHPFMTEEMAQTLKEF